MYEDLDQTNHTKKDRPSHRSHSLEYQLRGVPYEQLFKQAQALRMVSSVTFPSLSVTRRTTEPSG